MTCNTQGATVGWWWQTAAEAAGAGAGAGTLAPAPAACDEVHHTGRDALIYMELIYMEHGRVRNACAQSNGAEIKLQAHERWQ